MKTRALFCLACLVTVMATSSLLAADKKSAAEATPDKTVVFKETPQGPLKLHIFLPEESSTEARPAAVFFFGGGWVNGSPKQFYPHCRHLAEQGMVAISAEYRIRSKHKTTPFECVEDGKSAVRHIRKHADKWNIDPHRIAAGGGSAGGHVAACTGTLKEFDADGEDLSVSSVPNALVLFNPVVDTTAKGWAGGPKRLGDRARELSPLQHIHEQTPPTIIFHGTGDTTVPYSNVERFTAAMKEADHRCVLHGYEGRPHGFFNLSRNPEDYHDTIKKLDSFLASLGWIEENQ